MILSVSSFKPIAVRHRGSTASESSSMAGIFSSTGGESTPVGSRRRRVDVQQAATVAPPPNDEKSTAEISQLDVAVNQLSSMACDRTENHRDDFAKSSQTAFRQVNGDATGSTSAPHVVDLRQPVVLQPRTVIKLSSAATTVNAPSVVGSVIAPTGASKLVLSPTSAFTVAPGGSVGSDDIRQPSNGGRQRGRSAGRQQHQGGSSVKRMAMLFEEPPKRTDQPLQPQLPAISAAVPSSGATRARSGVGHRTQSSGNIPERSTAVSSELFFFPSVHSPDGTSSKANRSAATRTLGVAQLDATSHRSHSDLAEPRVYTSPDAVDRSASSAQMQSAVTFVVTKSAQLRSVNDGTNTETGGLTVSHQSNRSARNLVVIGNDNKQATLTWSPQPAAKQKMFTEVNSIEVESKLDKQMRRFAQNNQAQQQLQQSWDFDKKVVQKSANFRLPTEPTAAKSLVNIQKLTCSRDRLNFAGKSSDFDRPLMNRVPAIIDSSRLNSKNDTIETAMSALETAISMLGSAVASRTDAIGSSRSRGEKREHVSANRPARMQSADRLWTSSTGGRRAAEKKIETVGWTGGKFQEDLTLQTTLSLLDRTIVEIDSAISISDLTNHNRRSKSPSGTAVAHTAVVTDSRGRCRSPTADKSADSIFGLRELKLVGTERRVDAVESGWSDLNAAVLPPRSNRDMGGKVQDRAHMFLAERTFDISTARDNDTANFGVAHLRQVTKNSGAADGIVSFRMPTDKVFDGGFSRIDAAPVDRVINGDIWRSVGNSDSVRQVASPSASGDHRRAHPPLVKEDSFNRPDSPLFHETLPLPTESAIRRYRQQQGSSAAGSRVGGRSQQKQQRRRQMSSSDSDGGEQQKKQQVRRHHHRMRSASAGARLQSRGGRSRDG